MTTIIKKYYTAVESVAYDTPVVDAVCHFLQCTKADLIEVLRHRENPLQEVAGRNVGYGYIHYNKNDRGKNRIITQPLPQLKNIQWGILAGLENIDLHKENATALLKSKGISNDLLGDTSSKGIWFREDPLQKIALHLNASTTPYILHLDIESAFHQLSESQIEKKLFHLYKSYYHTTLFPALSDAQLQRVTAIITHLLTYDTHLAIGSPASPLVFHMVMHDTDKKLIEVLRQSPLEGMQYSRYLDDIIISFSRIITPTLIDLQSFIDQYTHLQKIYTEKDALPMDNDPLPHLMSHLNIFLSNTKALHSDEATKKLLREKLHQLRELLVGFRHLFTDLSDAYLQTSTDTQASDIADIYNRLHESYHHISVSFTKLISKLDTYKRTMDTQASHYPISLQSISHELQRVMENDGRPVSNEKIHLYYPHSSTLKKMLGIGFDHTGKITIPRDLIAKKIAFYQRMIESNKAPYKFTTEGQLDYKKILASIKGYKQYIVRIRKTITKKDADIFSALEDICKQHIAE